ncbi:MAG TPA: LanC-like protein [Polyangiaceae bacterium]|nr:LanC-like protein [Polyangiaceae bacterium]
MVALYDPGLHQALLDIPWQADAARGAVERIVADARAAFTPEGLWPAHPGDLDEGEVGPHMPLYFGAAGVVWALDHLVREGAAPPGPTFAERLPDILQRNREVMASELWRKSLGPSWQTRSWLLGDAGVLFTEWKTSASDAALSALADVVAANSDDPSRELMMGAAGTMLPAHWLYRAKGEGRWAELYRAGARALAASLAHDAAAGADLWTQNVFGQLVRYLGPVHGFAGNAFALIAGRELLDAGAWAPLAARFARTFEVTARRGPAGANWPAFIGQRPEKPLLVQHCHGAPGMVTGLAGLPEPIDELLIAAGELTWAAGPLAKGPSLCHGTAGNGFAFLKLFERTRDEAWLARARAFAMHAIAQSERAAAELGRRRYSLWTGDLGLACFLSECLRESARFPTFDVL